MSGIFGGTLRAIAVVKPVIHRRNESMKMMKRDNQMSPHVSPLDAIFERLNWGLPTLDRVFSDFDENGQLSTRLPRTNVQETEDSYVLELEMPGISKGDVEVSFENDTLIVKGEKKAEKEEKAKGGVVRREYHTTRYERSFNVHGVDSGNVSAKMEDGILFVTLPKSAERLGRKIDVS
jgi:HSP20 family protein